MKYRFIAIDHYKHIIAMNHFWWMISKVASYSSVVLNIKKNLAVLKSRTKS